MFTRLTSNNSRVSPAVVISAIAMFFALGGSAVAAKLITGKQIKNGSVAGVDIKNGSLTGGDIKNGSVKQADIAPGVLTSGPSGATGATGATGPTGPSNAYHGFHDASVSLTTPLTTVVSLPVPAGIYVISGKSVANNVDASLALIDCRLTAEGDFDQARVELAPTAEDDLKEVSFNVTHEFAADGVIDLSCNDFGSNVTLEDIKITAIKVGALTKSTI